MKYDGKGDLLYSAGESWGNKKVWTIYFWQTPWEKCLKPLYKNEQYNTNFLPLYKVKKIYDKEGNVLWKRRINKVKN